MSLLRYETRPRVIHVVVGHGLPIYYMNAIRSVRTAAPSDSVLVVDNASPSAALREKLLDLARNDTKMSIICRTSNDVSGNGKTGSLYAAYEEAFSHASKEGFDIVHIVQSDSQTLWWDSEFVDKTMEIFETNPKCVNIHTLYLPRDRSLSNEIEGSDRGATRRLRKYGLTDTGVYHLGRWRETGMHFGPAEQIHAKRYLEQGMQVLLHPWPTDAQIPWPAVIRNGRQRGREVAQSKPYLLKPLGLDQINRLKASSEMLWLEDVCVPWGWACVTPMWTTDLRTLDYWVMRYLDAKANGLSRFIPRLERRGITSADRRTPPWVYQRRPSMFALFVLSPVRGMASILLRRGS